MTAAENGDMQNVNVTLSDGANVNVHHQDIRKVSTPIIAYAPLIVTNIFAYLWSYFKVVVDGSKPFDRFSLAKHNKYYGKINMQPLLVLNILSFMKRIIRPSLKNFEVK